MWSPVGPCRCVPWVLRHKAERVVVGGFSKDNPALQASTRGSRRKEVRQRVSETPGLINMEDNASKAKDPGQRLPRFHGSAFEGAETLDWPIQGEKGEDGEL